MTTLRSSGKRRHRPVIDASALPIDSYARRSVGFDDAHAMNEPMQHDSNEAGIARAGRTVGLRLSDGVSAWDEETYREDWNRGIVRMETGLSGGMGIWQLDRFTRRMAELEDLFKRVRGMGCVLISMGMAYQIDNPMHRQMLRMLTVQSEASSDNTSFKVLDKFSSQREAGYWNGAGRRPFGMPGLDSGAKPDKYGRRPEVPADQVAAERAALVAGFRSIRMGTRSLQQLADEWNEAGLVGTMGVRWTNVTVRQALRRPIYAGLLCHRGEIVGQAVNVEPLVSREEWEAVQVLFLGRRRGANAPTRLASGLVHCSECGNPLVSRPRNGIPAYLCTKDRKRGCGKVSTFAEYVDRFLRELAMSRLSDPAVAEAIGSALARSNEEASELSAQVAADREMATNLGQSLGAGELPYDAFAAAIGPINQRIKAAEQRLAEMATTTEADFQAADRAAVESDWDGADDAGRRAMLRDALRGARVEIRPGVNRQFTDERMSEWVRDRVAVLSVSVTV